MMLMGWRIPGWMAVCEGGRDVRMWDEPRTFYISRVTEIWEGDG